MGNVAGKLSPACLCTANTAGDISRRHDIAVILSSNPLSHEGLGHSFCYVKPDNNNTTNINNNMTSKSLSLDTNTNTNNNSSSSSSFFNTISGASISANASTALSTTLLLDATYPFTMESASSFSSSPYFASVPLQPIPRNGVINSGPLPTVRRSGSSSGSNMGSGPIERGFLSGPIERGFISGPLVDPRADGKFTKFDKIKAKYKINKWGSIKGIKDSILTAIWGDRNGSNYDYYNNHNHNNYVIDRTSVGRISGSSVNYSGQFSGFCDDNGNDQSIDNMEGLEYENVQWAQGKAGEDRVHIVVSEDHGWVFVGIYDGFNGPDAPDFLLSNLYSAVHKELKSELEPEPEPETLGMSNQSSVSKDSSFDDSCCCSSSSSSQGGVSNVVRCDRQVLELDEKVREKLNKMGMNWSRKNTKHSDVVLKALSEALRKTEEAYLDIADNMVKENPELSLMGSCVLVMLMIGEDVYLLNVGDSRAVLGRKSTVVSSDVHAFDDFPTLTPLQLTVDHNTYVKEEVQRIRKEHPDDPSAVVNDRVKGSLKVTRAFGAGFLKQPKWNDALLEMFRIEYVGSSPYLTCSPSLIHHKLSPRDKFIILSSDGLYDQYFTNEEAVSEVELFMASTPEGDPAQHLIEQVLFRAAKKSGIDFYELLDIPQGERRRYHDDVSVIVISLEGRIWRSSV